MRLASRLGFVLSVCLWTSTASASPVQLALFSDTINSYSYTTGTSAPYESISEIAFALSVPTYYFAFPTPPTLFENLFLDASDIGSTFYADATNDPDFAAFAAYLTNGIAATEPLWITHRGNPPTTNFGAGTSNTLELDFAGYSIDRVGLTLNSFSLTHPDPRYNDLAILANVYFSIEGTALPPSQSTVPEPGSLLLLGTGLVGVWARRWRRR